MKKVILCGMLLGLLTGMCFAQRGVGRPMGTEGPTARMGPDAVRSFPNATSVGPHVGHAGSNIGVASRAESVHGVGVGRNAKTVTPDAAVGANQKTVRPDAPVGANAKDVRPDAAVGTDPRSVAPRTTTAPDAGQNPQ